MHVGDRRTAGQSHLLDAGVAAWRSGVIRRPICVVAAILAIAQILPPVAWIAAILLPVWLGVAAGTAHPRRAGTAEQH